MSDHFHGGPAPCDLDGSWITFANFVAMVPLDAPICRPLSGRRSMFVLLSGSLSPFGGQSMLSADGRTVVAPFRGIR